MSVNEQVPAQRFLVPPFMTIPGRYPLDKLPGQVLVAAPANSPYDFIWTDPGEATAKGDAGWSPVLALTPVGNAVVLQVYDWVGGAGTKPPVGDYVGPTGLVPDPNDAVNVRGSPGLKGDKGDDGDQGEPGLGADAIFVSFSWGEAPSAPSVLALIPIPRASTLPANLAGTFYHCLDYPSVPMEIEVSVFPAGGGSTVLGSINIATDGTITTTTSAMPLAQGAVVAFSLVTGDAPNVGITVKLEI